MMMLQETVHLLYDRSFEIIWLYIYIDRISTYSKSFLSGHFPWNKKMGNNDVICIILMKFLPIGK